jgi:dTDP-4-dehydrorhamnose 3,5-epimerase
MKFHEAPLSGAAVIEIETHEDDRGFFARAFCQREFEEHGLGPTVAQCNMAFNHEAGTLRGMHYQLPPAAEAKLIRCIRGAVYDVIVDLRLDSPTYLHHFGVELSADNRRALYVPELFAHGYQTLADDTEVLYQVSEFYTPGQERGLRHDDPLLAIDWPLPVSVISPKDAAWPHMEPDQLGVGS